MLLDNLSTKYFKFKYNESEDQETNSILLLNFINKCLESAKNIDILILGGNNKICSIDAKLIVSRATSVIHLTIWNFLSLTINHLELNSDDNNSITINRSGHNLILWNSSWDLWNSRHNTWNIIGGYWWWYYFSYPYPPIIYTLPNIYIISTHLPYFLR